MRRPSMAFAPLVFDSNPPPSGLWWVPYLPPIGRAGLATKYAQRAPGRGCTASRAEGSTRRGAVLCVNTNQSMQHDVPVRCPFLPVLGSNEGLQQRPPDRSPSLPQLRTLTSGSEPWRALRNPPMRFGRCARETAKSRCINVEHDDCVEIPMAEQCHVGTLL